MTSLSNAAFSDSFIYNGLGLRVGKTDSTGSYVYLCDGASLALRIAKPVFSLAKAANDSALCGKMQN